jgi:hypothetical protein
MRVRYWIRPGYQRVISSAEQPEISPQLAEGTVARSKQGYRREIATQQ